MAVTPQLRVRLEDNYDEVRDDGVEELPVSSHSALDIAAVSPNVYIGSKTSYQGKPTGEDIEGAGSGVSPVLTLRCSHQGSVVHIKQHAARKY